MPAAPRQSQPTPLPPTVQADAASRRRGRSGRVPDLSSQARRRQPAEVRRPDARRGPKEPRSAAAKLRRFRGQPSPALPRRRRSNNARSKEVKSRRSRSRSRSPGLPKELLAAAGPINFKDSHDKVRPALQAPSRRRSRTKTAARQGQEAAGGVAGRDKRHQQRATSADTQGPRSKEKPQPAVCCLPVEDDRPPAASSSGSSRSSKRQRGPPQPRKGKVPI